MKLHEIKVGHTYQNHGRKNKTRHVLEISRRTLTPRVRYVDLHRPPYEERWENLATFAQWASGPVSWFWPLQDCPHIWPDAAGQFGAVRKHDVHTGLDLYCPIDTPVVAVEPGEIVKVEPFTGEFAGSPWWNNTWAVLVEGPSGVVVYGEVTPHLEEGQIVRAGERLGTVTTPVLKKDKGRPTTMLHLELMLPGSRETLWWKHDEPKPRALLDPSVMLKSRARNLEQWKVPASDRPIWVGVTSDDMTAHWHNLILRAENMGQGWWWAVSVPGSQDDIASVWDGEGALVSAGHKAREAAESAARAFLAKA